MLITERKWNFVHIRLEHLPTKIAFYYYKKKKLREKKINQRNHENNIRYTKSIHSINRKSLTIYINWFHYLFFCVDIKAYKFFFLFPRRKCSLKRLNFPTIYIFSKDYNGINNKKKKSKIMHIFLWVFNIKCAFLSIFFYTLYRCFRILIFFHFRIAKDTMNFLLRLQHHFFFRYVFYFIVAFSLSYFIHNFC